MGASGTRLLQVSFTLVARHGPDCVCSPALVEVACVAGEDVAPLAPLAPFGTGEIRTYLGSVTDVALVCLTSSLTSEVPVVCSRLKMLGYRGE